MPISKELLEKISQNTFTEKHLDLKGQMLKDVDIFELTKALENNRYIKAIDLSYNDIGDNGIKELAKNKQIEELNLSNGISGYDDHYNHITAVGIKFLAQSNLNKLNLNGNPIGDEGIKHLATSKNMTELDVEDCNISADGLCFLLKINTSLKRLNVSSNEIEDKGLSTIADNHTLEELDLSMCKITGESTRFIEKNDSLVRLQLAENDIGQGAGRLANHVKIKFLGLGQCNVCDDALFFFGENKTIKELVLSYNKITTKGLKAISKNSVLTALHVGHNDIFFDEQIINNLISMKSLLVFTGEDNSVSDKVKQHIEKLCKKSSIKQFDLTIHNGIKNTEFITYHFEGSKSNKRKHDKTDKQQAIEGQLLDITNQESKDNKKLNTGYTPLN